MVTPLAAGHLSGSEAISRALQTSVVVAVEGPPPIPLRGSFQRSHDTFRNELVWFGRRASAASLLIRGPRRVVPCCFNDNHGGAGAKWGGGRCLLFTLCNAACQPPPSTTPTPPPPAVNQSQCLFNYWDQRGPFTYSSSLSLVQSPVFSPPPHLLSFPLCLPSSPISGCSICLTVRFHFYGLESLL